MKRIAIIVGHTSKRQTSKRQGAENYLGQSEYEFNSIIAAKTREILTLTYGVPTNVLFRNPNKNYTGQVREIVREVKELKADYAISLHFNASVGAKGCEVLVPESATEIDDHFADTITDMLNEELNIVERRDDGVFEIDSSHNGAYMLYSLNSAGIPCGLVEPCFSHESLEARNIFERPDFYSDLLARAIVKGFKIDASILTDDKPIGPAQDILLIRGDAVELATKVMAMNLKFLEDYANND